MPCNPSSCQQPSNPAAVVYLPSSPSDLIITLFPTPVWTIWPEPIAVNLELRYSGWTLFLLTPSQCDSRYCYTNIDQRNVPLLCSAWDVHGCGSGWRRTNWCQLWLFNYYGVVFFLHCCGRSRYPTFPAQYCSWLMNSTRPIDGTLRSSPMIDVVWILLTRDVGRWLTCSFYRRIYLVNCYYPLIVGFFTLSCDSNCWQLNMDFVGFWLPIAVVDCYCWTLPFLIAIMGVDYWVVRWKKPQYCRRLTLHLFIVLWRWPDEPLPLCRWPRWPRYHVIEARYWTCTRCRLLTLLPAALLLIYYSITCIVDLLNMFNQLPIL